MAEAVKEVCLRCNMPSEQRVHRTIREFERKFGYRPTPEQVMWLAGSLATGDYVQRTTKAK